MEKSVIDEMSRLCLSEKVNVECSGDGDSLAVTNNICAGPGGGSEMSQLENGIGENMGFNLHHDHDHLNDHKTLELFKTTVSKRKNIYSTDPVPLSSPWTFWVDRTVRGVDVKQYEANLKRINTVFTVYNFWYTYNNIPKPSSLKYRSSLHMMRDECKPVWEESYNCKGGTFRLRVQKKDTDKVWKEMLMAVIGEQMSDLVTKGDEVCGVTVSIRDREDLILIWNSNAELASQAKVFDCVRLMLPDTNFVSTCYYPHETHRAFKK